MIICTITAYHCNGGTTATMVICTITAYHSNCVIPDTQYSNIISHINFFFLFCSIVSLAQRSDFGKLFADAFLSVKKEKGLVPDTGSVNQEPTDDVDIDEREIKEERENSLIEVKQERGEERDELVEIKEEMDTRRRSDTGGEMKERQEER